MAVKPLFASEFWCPLFIQEALYQYNGEYYCPVNPPLASGGTNIISIVKSIDVGVPNGSNAGITWREVDAPGRPDETWSYFYPGVSQLSQWRCDRHADVLYFVVVRSYSVSDMELQVGSFDLATETWGPKGTDNGTNPLYFGANEDISGVDIRCLGVDDLFITYQVNDVTGVGTGTQKYYGVRYNAGTWGTPFEIGTTGDPTLYNNHITGIRQIHKTGEDYIHFIWAQESGATGNPPPNDSSLAIYTQPYTISTDTLGAVATIETISPVQHGANASTVTMEITFGAPVILGDQAFLNYRKPRIPGSVFDASNRRSLRCDCTLATPTFTSDAMFTYLANYDANWRMVIDPDGNLISVRSEWNDYTGSPANIDDTILPQIVYQAWDTGTSSWGAEQLFYQLATPALLPRTDGYVPPPYSLIVDDIRTYYPYGAGHGSVLFLNSAAIGPSSTTGTGFCYLGEVTFVTDDTGYPTNAGGIYFFSDATEPTPGTSNNVMFFGMVGM